MPGTRKPDENISDATLDRISDTLLRELHTDDEKCPAFALAVVDGDGTLRLVSNLSADAMGLFLQVASKATSETVTHDGEYELPDECTLPKPPSDEDGDWPWLSMKNP